MTRLGIIAGPFVPAGLCEIAGGYPVCGRMREQKPPLWKLIGAAVLASCGGVAALRPIPTSGGHTPLAGASSSSWRRPGAC